MQFTITSAQMFQKLKDNGKFAEMVKKMQHLIKEKKAGNNPAKN
jgi:hypothetical protein